MGRSSRLGAADAFTADRHVSAYRDDGTGTIRRWTVRNHSYSYTDGDEPLVYTHTLEMEEMEDFMPTRLHISDLSVEPYTYEEEFQGDALIITARVALSDEDGR